ncbi:MAG: DUF3048 domain-containing protein [Candidatus Limnocylindrales bacterium]
MIGTSRRAFWFRRSWPFLAVGAAVVLGAVGLLWASGLKAGVSSIPTPTLAALGPTTSASPVATPTPSPTPSPLPTPTPSPPPVAATTSGVWLPASQAALATRHPIAVMIDDQAAARPQSGLASADIVYQAPAEGGIPRYMAIFQTANPPAIGPVRSSRLYFIAWAAEYRALYVHVGGAPNALAYLRQVTGRLVYDADEFRWGGGAGYLWRVTTRFAPHNVYSSGAKLEALAKRVGATAPLSQAAWTFRDDLAFARRPNGGSIVVPYSYNRISYTYDPFSNRYRRAVTGEETQVDAGTKQVVAPANVVVLTMRIGTLANTPSAITNQKKHRLEVQYTGSGSALVFNNGGVIQARWSKASDGAPTILTYAAGPLKGQPVPLVRGQTFVQVVAVSTKVTWSLGRIVPRRPGVMNAE